jgi:ABC-type branched-subunit amino acid transport system substrate-binding protein
MRSVIAVAVALVSVATYVTLFRKLAAEGIAAVSGPVSSTGSENVMPLANSLRVPAIDHTSLRPGLSGGPYGMRLHPTGDAMIP